jgi:hypothetical protein
VSGSVGGSSAGHVMALRSSERSAHGNAGRGGSSRTGRGADTAAATGAERRCDGDGDDEGNSNKEGSNGTGHTRRASRRPAAAERRSRGSGETIGAGTSKVGMPLSQSTGRLAARVACAGWQRWASWLDRLERRTAHPPPAARLVRYRDGPGAAAHHVDSTLDGSPCGSRPPQHTLLPCPHRLRPCLPCMRAPWDLTARLRVHAMYVHTPYTVHSTQ